MVAMQMSSLESRLADYIAQQLPLAGEVRVDQLERIFGGASRETFRFVLSYSENGASISRHLILRRDPVGSLIETNRETEFAAYRAFQGTSVPVPEALWLEAEGKSLDFPFFIMEELRGFESSPQRIIGPPYAQHSEKLATQKWTILGQISRADPQALRLDAVMDCVPPDECWKRELDYWEQRIDEDEMSPEPVIRAAIRWLRRRPPPPAQKLSVVHGDYRTGNFLFDTDGNIRGILDWEMAHLGDPLEDLAWSLNPVWCWSNDGRVGGLTQRETAIGIWETASGLRAYPEALLWWEVFSSVKGQAIWISSAREFSTGKNQDLILAFAGWMMGNSQDRAALKALGHLP
jgi:aminoglycoside phosphotransferase (APT) family kinase protein